MKAVFLSLMLLLQVRAAARADEFPRLEVSAAPSRVRMAAGEDWSGTRYTFRNLSPHEFRVVERSAFFHAFDTKWQSGIIGPIPTPLKVKALAETTWDDDVWIAPEIVTAAREAGALPNQELLFVQSFTLLGRAAPAPAPRVADLEVVRLTPRSHVPVNPRDFSGAPGLNSEHRSSASLSLQSKYYRFGTPYECIGIPYELERKELPATNGQMREVVPQVVKCKFHVQGHASRWPEIFSTNTSIKLFRKQIADRIISAGLTGIEFHPVAMELGNLKSLSKKMDAMPEYVWGRVTGTLLGRSGAVS